MQPFFRSKYSYRVSGQGEFCGRDFTPSQKKKKKKASLSKFLSVESKKILVYFISSGFITSDKLQRGRAYRIEK